MKIIKCSACNADHNDVFVYGLDKEVFLNDTRPDGGPIRGLENFQATGKMVNEKEEYTHFFICPKDNAKIVYMKFLQRLPLPL